MQRLLFLNWKILLIILLEGFVTISLEILAIRQLTTFVGNSIITTSLIIGLFLLCLAYGYRTGGQLRKNLLTHLRRNFLIAAVGVGFGLSYVFIDVFFFFVQHKLHISLIWALVLYMCLIISPVIYFLGQTVPITMHLLDQKDSPGKLGGKVLHLNTIGSFLGSVLTAIVLMTFLGVAWTIITNVLILAFLILIISNRQRFLTVFVLLFVLLGLVYIVNRTVEKSIFIGTTPYANYSVIKEVTWLIPGKVGSIFSVNNSYSSFIDQDKQGFAYIEFIKKILFQQLKLQNKSILVLGSGGFTLSAENTFGNHFTYVDIDPKIRAMVQQNFLKNINGDFVAADARQYVKAHPNTYDVIVSDTYSSVHLIPAQLLTINYFEDLKAALKPGGIAIFNIIAPPLLNTRYGESIDNTLRMAFTYCTASPLQFSETSLSNIIYVCQKNADTQAKTVYTDNLNRSSLDTFSN